MAQCIVQLPSNAMVLSSYLCWQGNDTRQCVQQGRLVCNCTGRCREEVEMCALGIQFFDLS